MSESQLNRVRFGAFELDLKSGELRKGKQTILLQEQPFRVLRIILERGGEVATRQEIQKRLWPNDTVVEFDHGINTAIKKIRQALDDSAEAPKHIQTVARRGYRLLVPMERIDAIAESAPRQSGRVDAQPTSEPGTFAAGELTGKRFSHYRVLEILGGGGMGIVYKAVDLKLGRTVALKFLPEELGEDERAVERFEREARAASALDHPNICSIYEFGEHDGRPFIVMQLLAGRNLRDVLEESRDTHGYRFGLQQLLDLSMQISAGLEAAHEKGIIHRDIKPANIFLTQRGEAKILDFGVAKMVGMGEVVDSENQAGVEPGGSTCETGTIKTIHLTRAGAALGTQGYMSPEQAQGERVDRRSDLFSLGVVIYEMATGRRPFAGSTPAQVLDSILNREPQPATEIRPELPPAFGSLVERLMAKLPQDRYSSAREVSQALLEMQHPGQTAPSGRARGQSSMPSVAVLPFANLSADPDNQYFSDGLSEDLISALTRLRGLHVTSRTSAFRFRDGRMDIREIGRQLSVDSVLEGSVRRSGQRVRITAQLVNVVDGYHLWSERYDREITDIFEIQDEITAAIIKTLEPTLLGQQSALTRRHSENLQAYDLYLKGRLFWDQRSESSLRAGLECFRAAIDLDPGYALAYLGVADSFSILAVYGYMSLSDGRPRAEAAMKRALDLDPTLLDAHFSLCVSSTIFGRPGEAELHFRKALELQPRSSLVHAYHALYLASRRHTEEALASVRIATSLDPLSPLIHGLCGVSLQCSGHYEEALQEAERSLELQPNSILGLWSRQLAACHLSRWRESFAAGERLVSVTRRSAIYLGQLAMAYGMAGQRDKALALHEELVQRQQAGEYISPVAFLAIDAGLRDVEAGRADILAYLEDGGNGWGIEVALGSYLDEFATYPACAELLRRIARTGEA